MGTTDPFTCVPRTSCRTAALTRVAQTAMAYLFVAWMLVTGFTVQDAVLMLAGVLTLVTVTASAPSPRIRAMLARMLEPAPAPLMVSAS